MSKGGREREWEVGDGGKEGERGVREREGGREGERQRKGEGGRDRTTLK